MMKCLKMRCLTVLMSFFILVNTTFVPVMSVQSAAVPVVFGMVEIMKGLLISAGISILGYTAIKNASTDDVYPVILDAATSDADIAAMLDDLEAYDNSGACEQLEDGEEYVSDYGFKVIKGGKNDNDGDNNSDEFSLGVTTAIAQRVADIVKKFVYSDDNQYEITVNTEYDDYIESNYAPSSFESLDDIADLYGQEVVDRLSAKGYTDENCSVILYKSQNSNNSDVMFCFIPIPKDYSFVGYMGTNGYAERSDESVAFSVIDTESLLYIFNGGLSKTQFDDYIYSHRIALDAVYFDFINSEFYEFEELDSGFDIANYMDRTGAVKWSASGDSSAYKGVFNFDNMLENTHLWVNSIGYYIVSPNYNNYAIKTMFPLSVGNYISDAGTALDTSNINYITVNFDEDTALRLANETDLKAYIEYVLSISDELSSIGNVIEDNQAQDNANAQGIMATITQQTTDLLNGLKSLSFSGIINAIAQQTRDLLAGIQDAILAALAAAVVPDLDYWETELDTRIDALEDSASILVLPLTIITLLFGVVVDSDGVGDFILTIPPIKYKGYVLYEGCSFNFNDFVEQDYFSELHDLFIVITDAMVVFWIANYAARKFNSIIGGR